jgi:predicted PurR-regulated permease PerM
MTIEATRDLTRTVLAVLCLGALIGLSIWIVKPFLGAAIWATMIVVASWSWMRALQMRLGNRRWLAVTIMTLALLLILVVPFSAAIGAIVGNIDTLTRLANSVAQWTVPPPPEWSQSLPLIGDSVAQFWKRFASLGIKELAPYLVPYARQIAQWFLLQAGSVGAMLAQFLLTTLIAAILYARGESVAAGLVAFAHRLAGERGEAMVHLAAQAIRGVALGVIVTALAQTVLGSIALAIAGVPYVALLATIMFITAIAQIGAVPVMIPAVIWLYWSDDLIWGTVLLVATVLVGTLDNVLRPLLIKKGADLPLLLIFTGVIGGIIAFGLIGIFVGPVVLAVSYTLLASWVREGRDIAKSE